MARKKKTVEAEKKEDPEIVQMMGAGLEMLSQEVEDELKDLWYFANCAKKTKITYMVVRAESILNLIDEVNKILGDGNIYLPVGGAMSQDRAGTWTQTLLKKEVL